MRTIALIAAALLLALAAQAWSAAPVPTGTITGTVENLTGGRRAVAGVEVKLTAYVNNAEADWKTAKTDARGRFSFSVPTASDRVYVTNVKYKGGDYDSQPVTFKTGDQSKTIAMRVYEPTTDAGILRVNVHHMIVEIGQGMVQVAELLVFTNPTDRTYVGAKVRPDGKRDTLVFSIPTGAKKIEYLEGLMECCVFATAAGGLQDTMDVKPGVRQIAYSYTLPYTGTDLRIARTIDYRADRVEVFGKMPSQMQVAPLAAQPAVTTEQGSYTRFSGERLPARGEISILLSGLPVTSSTARRLAIAAFAGVIAAALAYPLLRRTRRKAVRAAEPTTQEALVAAIARLDDEFEAGHVPRPQYEAARARYKSLLRDLIQTIGTE